MTAVFTNSSVYAIPGVVRRTGNYQDILNITAEYFGLSLCEIKQRSREEKFRLPRQIAMYVYRKETDLTQSFIGNLCGGFDHSNVWHAEKTVSNAIETKYKTVADDVSAILSLIQ